MERAIPGRRLRTPERCRTGLERWAGWLPEGRALDVATGAGRNALFLAERGYEVDAVDVADEALARAQERAADRDLTVSWIQARLASYQFPTALSEVIVVGFYHTLVRLPELTEALAPGGVHLYVHHLRADPAADRGPRDDRHRFRATDLLRACLDLTVLPYAERTRVEDGRRAAVASIAARNTTGGSQSYPPG